jgi:hypothetical protein
MATSRSATADGDGGLTGRLQRMWSSFTLGDHAAERLDVQAAQCRRTSAGHLKRANKSSGARFVPCLQTKDPFNADDPRWLRRQGQKSRLLADKKAAAPLNGKVVEQTENDSGHQTQGCNRRRSSVPSRDRRRVRQLAAGLSQRPEIHSGVAASSSIQAFALFEAF